MNMLQSFKMAIATIRINKVRSFLTMLGIIIGVTSVIGLVSVMQGYNADLTQYYEKMGVNKISVTMNMYKFSDSVKMYDELYEYINKDISDLASGVSPATTTSGTIQYDGGMLEDTSTVYLGNEQFSICNNYDLKDGRDISYMDVQNATLSV